MRYALPCLVLCALSAALFVHAEPKSGELGPTNGEKTSGIARLSSALFGVSTAYGEEAKVTHEPTDVSMVDFGADGKVRVGFFDGRVATFSPSAKRAKLKKVSRKAGPIVAMSPSGDMAVVRSTPPRLVRVKNAKDLLVLSYMERLEGAAFSPDGKTMFLSGSDGILRVWTSAHELPKKLGGQVRLQDYLNQAKGDFSANFGSMSGMIAAGEGPALLYAEPDGQMVYWDMNRPTEAKYVLRVPPPIQSMVVHGDHLLATSSEGELRASVISEGNMLRWSVKARGLAVAADPAEPERFVALHADGIKLHDVATGAVLWEESMGEGGAPCGLAVSKKVGAVVACVDQIIQVRDLETGVLLSARARKGDTMRPH
ncbi:MAG: WD40 repeat domain-containing protein [Myxococcota bacterium]